jgi:hypothetical protein
MSLFSSGKKPLQELLYGWKVPVPLKPPKALRHFPQALSPFFQEIVVSLTWLGGVCSSQSTQYQSPKSTSYIFSGCFENRKIELYMLEGFRSSQDTKSQTTPRTLLWFFWPLFFFRNRSNMAPCVWRTRASETQSARFSLELVDGQIHGCESFVLRDHQPWDISTRPLLFGQVSPR